MALLNIFKKKKPGGKKPAKEEIKPIEKSKEAEEKVAVVPRKERKITGGEAYRVLKTPHVTEKASALAAKNQYVFKIYSRANKTEVKKAVEDVFGVEVISVRIVNVPKKKRRLGRIEGWRKGYKKAIVKIKEGQKIEVLPR